MVRVRVSGAPTPTCYHVHGGNRCPNKRHKTSGNTIVKLCTLHYKRSRSKRATPTKTDNKIDKDQKRANDAIKKRNSRQRNKDKVTGIEDEQIRKLVQQLSVIKESVHSRASRPVKLLSLSITIEDQDSNNPCAAIVEKLKKAVMTQR